MIISLPWPDKRLSPNARLHWRAKVGPKQAAKIAAGWATVAAKGFYDAKEALALSDGPIPVEMRFYPPDARLRDDDNMIGSMKAARDGIADALGVDDRRFRPHYFFEAPEKPGRIEVFIPINPPVDKPVFACCSACPVAQMERAAMTLETSCGPNQTNANRSSADGS